MNGVSVVKVGHRQVVSLIRQGGSRLLMKVVSVTRKPDTGDVVRKKGVYPNTTTHNICSKNAIRPLESQCGVLNSVSICRLFCLNAISSPTTQERPEHKPNPALKKHDRRAGRDG